MHRVHRQAVRHLAALVPLTFLAVAIVWADQTPRPDPSAAALDRASAYVAGYVRSVSSVVSEERYEQVVQTQGYSRVGGGGMSGSMGGPSTQTRTLVSDYLLVLVPGANEWVPFRDVYSVDGKAVRDRTNRLLKLFVEPHADAFQQAERIQAESSRYNIGDVTRDINVPSFALQYLLPQYRSRSQFRVKGTEEVAGITATVVEFEERATPTLIAGREHENVPARGRFWIDPSTGVVLRTLLETRPAGMTTRITVTYQRDARLELWVPARMEEKHSLSSERVEGEATYTNFRRFQVETTVDIKK